MCKSTYRKGGFTWQDGYYAVTISSGDLEVKRLYIERQEEHHGGSNGPEFLDELKLILKENNVDFDPKYLE